MPTQDKLTKEFARLLRAYNKGRKVGRLEPYKKIMPLEAARRRKELNRLQKVAEDAKIGAAHYESPGTKHLREMFTRDLKTVTERARGKDITKLKPKPHLKLVKSVLPMTTGGIGGAGLARPKLPRVRAEEKGGEIPDEMPETGADIRGAIRGLFPKLSPEMQERLRHTRMPMSQFTQAEIENPYGTITPERMQISPESFLLMPGVTAQQILKNLHYNPVTGELLHGRRMKEFKKLIKRFPKSVLDYIEDVKYMTPKHMKTIIKEEGRTGLARTGALWEPKFFTTPPDPRYIRYGEPGEVLINPRAISPLRRLLAHEVGHGGEEAIRKSIHEKNLLWKSPRQIKSGSRFIDMGLARDYPDIETGSRLYDLSPHEQWARAFDEHMVTGGKLLKPETWYKYPPPPMRMRGMLRDMLETIKKHGIP